MRTIAAGVAVIGDGSFDGAPSMHRDAVASRLSQGCSRQLACVQVERFTGSLPPARAFEPPLTVAVGGTHAGRV
jgi:hypothetical protein